MLLDSVWHRVLPGILAEAAEDPQVSLALRDYWMWRRDSVGQILDRGIQRKQVKPGTDPEHVLDMIDGPILLRLLVTRSPLDYRFADELVDRVARALGGS